MIFFYKFFLYRFSFLTAANVDQIIMFDAISFLPDPINDTCHNSQPKYLIYRLKLNPFKRVLLRLGNPKKSKQGKPLLQRGP
jgi:hypothetical protein